MTLTAHLDECLTELLACETRHDLREAWLALTDNERAALRWSEVLGRHARRVLDRAYYADRQRAGLAVTA